MLIIWRKRQRFLRLAGSTLVFPAFESRLFGVGPSSVAVLSGTALGPASVAVLASWLPARRAAKEEPVEVLRP